MKKVNCQDDSSFLNGVGSAREGVLTLKKSVRKSCVRGWICSLATCECCETSDLLLRRWPAAAQEVLLLNVALVDTFLIYTNRRLWLVQGAKKRSRAWEARALLIPVLPGAQTKPKHTQGTPGPRPVGLVPLKRGQGRESKPPNRSVKPGGEKHPYLAKIGDSIEKGTITTNAVEKAVCFYSLSRPMQICSTLLRLLFLLF